MEESNQHNMSDVIKYPLLINLVFEALNQIAFLKNLIVKPKHGESEVRLNVKPSIQQNSRGIVPRNPFFP